MTLDRRRATAILDTLPAEVLANATCRGTIKPMAHGSSSEASPNDLATAFTLPNLPALRVTRQGDNSEADFEVHGRLGEGGMGVVTLAEQRALRRMVALKTLRDGVHDATVEAALLQEAVVMGRLEHPNIVPVHLLGKDEQQRSVIVMKRVAGVSWAEIISDPDHPAWEQFDQQDRLRIHLQILMQLCNAVHHAHRNHVLHRDIKPENVMLGDLGEVYLLDWGVAAKLPPEGLTTDALVGTIAYMAPEMACPGLASLTERTDVFLLGATLYEALSGHPPFAQDDVRTALITASVAEFPPIDGIPGELSGILRRAMAWAPDERFESALELRRTIADFLEHRSSLQLSEEADARRIELETLLGAVTRDDEAVHQRFSEAHIGYRMALRQWSGNQAAREGAARALLLMSRIELMRRQPAAAWGWLQEARDLVDVDDTVLEREARQSCLDAIEELRIEMERVRTEVERATQALSHLSARRGHRTRMILGVIVVIIFFLADVVVVLYWGKDGAPAALLWWVALALNVVIVGGSIVLRRKLGKTRMSTILSMALVAAHVGMLYSRTIGWSLGLTGITILVVDMATFAAASLMTAVADIRFAWMQAVYLVGIGMALVFPQCTLPMFIIATLLPNIGAMFVMTRLASHDNSART